MRLECLVTNPVRQTNKTTVTMLKKQHKYYYMLNFLS